MRVVTGLVLAWAVVSTWSLVYDFGQHRFFTIDEYQYGHATWLVAQGERPYLDFYEHHFPLSYALHAPIISDEAGFVARALAAADDLRSAICSRWRWACWLRAWWVTRNPFVAALSAILATRVRLRPDVVDRLSGRQLRGLRARDLSCAARGES